MDVRRAARAWADGWARAWRTHDPELVGSLYADGAMFRSQPFRPPQDPSAYAAWAFEDEQAVRCWFSEAHLVGDDRAAVEYWAVSTARDGTIETIGGVALLWFGPDGRVIDERDYWNTREGATDPYAGWARIES